MRCKYEMFHSKVQKKEIEEQKTPEKYTVEMSLDSSKILTCPSFSFNIIASNHLIYKCQSQYAEKHE